MKKEPKMKFVTLYAGFLVLLTTGPLAAQNADVFEVDCPSTSLRIFENEVASPDGAWDLSFYFFDSILPVLKPAAVEDLDGTQRLTCFLDVAPLNVNSVIEVSAASCNIHDEGEPNARFVCTR